MAKQHSIGGRHLIADLLDAPADRLRAADQLMACLESALREAGFHVLQVAVHRFTEGGEGFTGVVLLSESHAAIHTYPEAGYAALDVFSCGQADPRAIIDTMARVLDAEKVVLQSIPRGPATTPAG